MRNKTRFDFVDEFRKINTLEKLIPIENLFIDDQDEGKQENNKFIRYKDEYNLEENFKRDYELFVENPIITSYVRDVKIECIDKFDDKIDKISKDIHYYKDWSHVLNQDIKSRDYKHKFRYLQSVAPPPRLKQEPIQGNGLQIGDQRTQQKKKQSKGDTNIQLPQRGQQNFNQITKQIYSKQYSKHGSESEGMRDLSLKNQIAQLKKLQNLSQIQKIGDFYSDFGKFSYYVEPKPNLCDIDFIDNSIILSSNNLSFDYFRDIGMPSRNIKQYTLRNSSKLKLKGEDDGMQLLQAYSDQKRELIYLYFLKDEQLKINKNEMTFYDMANISTGRITSGNAHMCIRSEKVTLQQYEKLLRKMEKYDLRENETGQPKVDTGVGEDDADDINLPIKSQLEQNRGGDQNLNIEKIIQEINDIRKQVLKFQDSNSSNVFNTNNFNEEVYNKLESLLNSLFDMVVQKLPVRYSINQIRDHIHQIQGKNDAGYDRLRMLWFIVNCYEQLMSKQQKKINLRTMAYLKKNGASQTVRYKGKKVIVQTTQPKKVYGFQQRKNVNNRSKSPIWRPVLNRTPVKAESTISRTKTPLKGQAHTSSKLNTSKLTATVKKQPQTAHK